MPHTFIFYDTFISCLPDIVGGLGVAMTLFAYIALQMKKIAAHDLLYLSLNLFGSIFIIYSLVYSWNLYAFIVELVWGLISLYGLYQHVKKFRSSVAHPLRG